MFLELFLVLKLRIPCFFNFVLDVVARASGAGVRNLPTLRVEFFFFCPFPYICFGGWGGRVACYCFSSWGTSLTLTQTQKAVGLRPRGSLSVGPTKTAIVATASANVTRIFELHDRLFEHPPCFCTPSPPLVGKVITARQLKCCIPQRINKETLRQFPWLCFNTVPRPLLLSYRQVVHRCFLQFRKCWRRWAKEWQWLSAKQPEISV